jgi:UDP-N-acetylmuramyl pentapeptide phosphotransferase/UDP-N-acetylglucosamine-1-phosphate transferase
MRPPTPKGEKNMKDFIKNYLVEIWQLIKEGSWFYVLFLGISMGRVTAYDDYFSVSQQAMLILSVTFMFWVLITTLIIFVFIFFCALRGVYHRVAKKDQKE